MSETHKIKLTLPNKDSCEIVTGWEMTEDNLVAIFKVLAHFSGFSFTQGDRMSENLLDNEENTVL